MSIYQPLLQHTTGFGNKAGLLFYYFNHFYCSVDLGHCFDLITTLTLKGSVSLFLFLSNIFKDNQTCIESIHTT